MSDLPEDETIRVRRSWPGDPPAAGPDDFLIDEVTEVSRRRGRASASAAPARATPPPEPADAPPSAEGAARRRSTYIDADADGAEHDLHGTVALDDTTDGSTIVAHRESRRRAARTPDDARSAPVNDAVAPLPGRAAHTPDAAAGVVYEVRDAKPVVASRNPVAHTPAQVPLDGDADAQRRRRSSRRAILIVAGATSAAVLAAGATLVAILVTL